MSHPMPTAEHDTTGTLTNPLQNIASATPSEANLPAWYTNLKKGDIIYTPRSRVISVVTRIEGSNVYIIKLQYSMNSESGTWSLYGDQVVYELLEGILDDRLLPPPSSQYDVEEDEKRPIVNPSGTLIRTQVFNDGCPWGNCMGGLFCPGCGGVSMVFPDLFMSCGVLLACPICHGLMFAEQDKVYLQDLEYGNYSQEDEQKIWRHRCGLVDRRREELGLPPVASWD